MRATIQKWGNSQGIRDTEYIAEGFDWGSPAGKEVW